jgi:hypothetical protein
MFGDRVIRARRFDILIVQFFLKLPRVPACARGLIAIAADDITSHITPRVG